MNYFDQANFSEEGASLSAGNSSWQNKKELEGDFLASIVAVLGDVRRGQKPFPHPFPARMPIEVAQAAVKLISKPGDIVLDPMVGSGVVPKAALSLGRQALGVDIDPLAVVQGHALCASVCSASFAQTAEQVLKRAKNSSASTRKKLRWAALGDEDKAFIDYWFEHKHADELFALSDAIYELIDEKLFPVFATLFSSLIISRGSGSSKAMDLSRSRPHRVDSKVPKSPFDLWDKQVSAFKSYYENSKLEGNAAITIGDARDLIFPDESVDAIVTSPPYLNAIDYLRTSKFSLVFLGKRLNELRQIRADSVGTEVGLAAGNLTKSLELLVSERVADVKRQPMVRRYVLDIFDALSESYRVLRPGGKAVYVMGPSILSRRDYDAGEVLSEIARQVGFRPLGYGRRDIVQSRRSLPPPKRSERAESINKRMTCEYYVMLQKVAL